MNKILYFITEASVNGIGGAQLYTARRIKYLKEKKIDVVLITGNSSNLELEELKNTKLLTYNFLNSVKQDIGINNSKSKIIFNDMKELMGKYDEIYMECHDYELWFENICSKLKLKYSIYMLIEIPIFKEKNKDFYIEKLKRGEIIGVARESLKISFGKYYEKKYNKFVNVSFNEEEIETNLKKVKEFKLERKEELFRILIVSRLEKKYVEEAIKDILKLSSKISKNIELVIVGDSADKRKKIEFENRYKSNNKLKIKFLGYVNPLFKELYTNSDLFIGMGTALVNSAAFGCISLGIDPRNNKVSGVFGIDLFNSGYSEKNKFYSIYDKVLEIIKLEKKERECFRTKTKLFYEEEYSFKKNMNKLDTYIFNNENENQILKIQFDFLLMIKYYLKLILRKLKLEKIVKKFYKKIFKTKKLLEMQ